MRILITALFLAASPAAYAQSSYDGVWNVLIQTRAGSCDPQANYAVTVADGKVSGPAGASGTVGRSGNVKVSIGGAYANGQLNEKSGSGKWSAASGGVPCSGRWEASKQ